MLEVEIPLIRDMLEVISRPFQGKGDWLCGESEIKCRMPHVETAGSFTLESEAPFQGDWSMRGKHLVKRTTPVMKYGGRNWGWPLVSAIK